jgi:hypothetical protein
LYRFWSDQSRPIDENRLVCSKQFNVSPLQLSRFLGSCQRIILVPGVIVEVGRLARDELVHPTGSREFSLAPFWRLTIRELKLMGIDERWTSFLLLDGEIVGELGPTDAALIRCAQELGQEHIPILTHDQPLWGHCRKVHVSCMVTSEILPWLYMT